VNWKGWLKIVVATVAAPFTATLGHWATNAAGGVHEPFTATTILLPAIPILLQSLFHLFQAPPHKS